MSRLRRAGAAVRERFDATTRRFTAWVLAVAFGGLLLRIVVILLRPACPASNGSGSGCFTGKNDALYYHMQADLLADGHWYRILNPASVVESMGTTRPSALHPPVYSTLLGVLSWLGADSTFAHRIGSAVMGSVAIVLFAFVAKRLAGFRAGIIAAVLVAVYPAIWINDTLLLSEAAYAPVAGLFLLAAYRFWDRQTVSSAVLLGASVGLATLTRAEALLLAPLAVLPLALGARRLDPRAQFGRIAAAGGACVLLLAPWVIFNTVRFEEPVLISDSTGQGLAPANCDGSYYGPLLGYASSCVSLDLPPDYTELEQDDVLQTEARAYMWEQKGRLPLVMAARVGRTFDVYHPRQQLGFNWQFDNRGRWASAAALLTYYAMVPFGVAGAVLLYRRRVPISPLLALIATSVVLAATVYGLTRYRLPADLALAVLAAVGVDALLRKIPRVAR